MPWISLVVQWLRICMLMPGTWVHPLAWGDSICYREISLCVTTTESTHLKPVLPNKRSHCNEKQREASSLQLEKA